MLLPHARVRHGLCLTPGALERSAEDTGWATAQVLLRHAPLRGLESESWHGAQCLQVVLDG